MVVARGERVGTLYTLSGTHNHSISLAFPENQRTTLWHHRLGHLSESGMRIVHSKNALPGMKNIQLDFCTGCVYGKQKQVSFQRDGKEKKIERLELVHMDLCGPTTEKSLGGNFYFVSFIDDASRKTWIYAIKEKSDVITLLRNGKLLTVKRTPQENGLAKRMNRTIMERARCKRIHADLPLQFWAAAVDTAVYLINRNPASALNGGIPEEEWSVIGYGGDEYGYRLWDCEHNKIIRSRDVIFDESQLYKHKLQEHGIKKEKKEYMELDEPEDGQVPRIENPEVLDETTDTEIGAGDQQQVPETLKLRRSSRVRKAPDRLCLPLNSIFYTDSDDMLVAGSSTRRINELKKKLASTFSMKDLAHFKLSKELSPKNREDEEYMTQIHDKPKKGALASSEVDSQIAALSTIDAEYVATIEASKEIIWLQRLLTELGYGQVDCKLWTDSQSAIHLAKNSAFHSRTKHIQLRYHFLRSLLEDGQLNLEKIEGNKNPADMLTKVVDSQKLSLCSTLINLR
ncbi:hypothetical protein RJ639_041587 [Escallonia herrerae]|uniref:Integrase catalytic domain-containing protein n=1 Tax=Escallonia herrerae TaxID=1293975 RepID=A0AA89BC66_9ASTE|nr:hypothetical protein RJ639_041587 [Escallonia herrerae]